MKTNETFDAVEKEYELLCKKLELAPIKLDIYRYNTNSNETTSLGTSILNATPLFTPDLIVLPQDQETDLSNHTLNFPPANWCKFNELEWPQWRIELWHEVVHQVEYQIIEEWIAGVEQKDAWEKAIAYVADKFSVSSRDLSAIL